MSGAEGLRARHDYIFDRAIKSHLRNRKSNLARFRYALSEQESVANYTEEQYNSFGWARAAGALSVAELDDLYAKIQARSSLRTFHRSARGEAIVEVNDKPHTTLGVDNVFAFVKGTKNNFTITRVFRFDFWTETEMDLIREDLYEGRTCSDTYFEIYKEKGFAREYQPENSQSFAEYSKERAERGASNGETGRGVDQNNRRSAKYRSGYSLHIGEDGEITERFALPEEKTESKGKDSDITGKDTETARADVKDAGKNTDTAGKGTGADTDGKKDFAERLTTRTVRAVSEALSRGMDASEWRGKKLSAEVRGAEAVSHLFDRMITEPKNRERVAGKIADELIRSTVTARLYSTAVRQNAEVQESLAVAGVLGRYRGKLDLDGISAEVREKLGKRGNAQKYDATREELKEKNAKNAQRQRQRLEALREELKEKNAEIAKLRKQWYDVYRKNHYQAADEARYNREANRAVAAAGKIREWKTGAFRNASELALDSLIKPLGRLAKVASAGNVNQAGTRRVVSDLLAWHQANAEALKAGGYFNEEAVAAMQGCTKCRFSEETLGQMLSAEFQAMMQLIKPGAGETP